jgi:DNA-binding MarR family transcriptional regulator
VIKCDILSKVNIALHQRSLNEIPRQLAELLAIPETELKVERGRATSAGKADMVISSGDKIMIVQCKASGQADSVAMAARQARDFANAVSKAAIPLVVVPYMGEVGQQLCEEAGVSWLDLSGNARIIAPGLRVRIEGKPNRFKRAGRPRSLFAPKSARIARWLLMKRDQAFTQRELARVSGLDEGFTSRIVRGLEEQRLVVREADGAVRVANYDTLLDATREAYDFSKHHIVRGHVAARSSDDVLRRLAESFHRDKMKYAATGLAGAWLWSGFAGFRLVVLFVSELPDAKARGQMGFHEMERGENVWLVQPNDAGVFDGGEIREGVSCANPVQIYLDLKDHPERSTEAAEELRKKLLNPSADA